MGPQLDFVGDTEVLSNGQHWTFFGGNDYHRFSRHPEVAAALVHAVERYGINSAGSRITTANHALYRDLEHAIAGFLGAEEAVICSAGYLSAIMLLQGVVEEHDALFIDEIAHGSLLDGARQSGRAIWPFKHSEPADLEVQIKNRLTPGERPLILTDGVFASVGDLAPLQAYASIAARHGGKLVIDDAHAVGVIGLTGKGSWEEAGIPRGLVYQSGTLSKGLGGFGGFAAGNAAEMAIVRQRSSAFKGSTPMPMPVAAASIRAIEVLSSNQQKITALRELTLRVKRRLQPLGFAIAPGPAPILSVTYLDQDKNRILESYLSANGIFPSFIDYPGSPPGGHFRFTLSSAHSELEVERLCGAIESSAGLLAKK